MDKCWFIQETTFDRRWNSDSVAIMYDTKKVANRAAIFIVFEMSVKSSL